MQNLDDFQIPSQRVLDSMNDGIYIVDRDRKILFWGKSAERITGWRQEDIAGKHCWDGILCHEDKDGHRLCGGDSCPLWRAMATGQGSITPIIVFARSRAGDQVPMTVSVGPIRDAAGEVIGGVETFRDLSEEIGDLERVRHIQRASLQETLPQDPRVAFRLYYIPHDIVGGDYYAVTRLDENRFAFLLADATGHGVSSAFYTMYLHALWQQYWSLIASPAEFMATLSNRLNQLLGTETAFAAAVCGLADLGEGCVRLVGAGGPPPLLFRAGGGGEVLDVSGFPLGLIPSAVYKEVRFGIGPGDCLLLGTDGATEIADASGRLLDIEGLLRVLQGLRYP
ncbi:MAG: SpoIIE family protein phosphatase, partial [Planctomycetota bacterium]|nr:SpoIIE family protein phosphatase [Planctomycetota bacterium]